MSDETYRPRKPSSEQLKSADLLSRIHDIQGEAGVDVPREESVPPHFAASNAPIADGGLKVHNVPPQLAGMFGNPGQQQARPRQNREQSSVPEHLQDFQKMQDLMSRLSNTTNRYETIHLPSKGKFYDGSDGPVSGTLSLRPMTGEEEQILATPRFINNGTAIDKIFEKCIKEKFDTEGLLTVDRTYILIYLRSISYTPRYDVEVKCSGCDKQFATAINLDLEVDECPEEFGPEDLEGVLPVSGFKFRCRLSRGSDEREVSRYRDKRIKDFGADVADDTLAYRTALLVDELEGITDKKQIQMLAKKLPIADLNHLRNLVNEPPFGVNTKIDLMCPLCMNEFNVELPLDASFFFPRPKKGSTNHA